MDNNLIPFTSGPRSCLRCDEPLPRYHRGEVCKTCQAAPPEPDALDLEIAAAEAELKSRETGTKARPTPTGIEVGKVRLVPVEALPSRQNAAGDWDRVLDEFIRSGLQCVRIEAGDLRAKSAFGALRARLCVRRRDCYPTMRGGHCYLVRTRG